MYKYSFSFCFFVFWITLQLRSLNEHRHSLGEGVISPDGGPVFQTTAGLCRNCCSNGRWNWSHPLLCLLQRSARVSFSLSAQKTLSTAIVFKPLTQIKKLWLVGETRQLDDDKADTRAFVFPCLPGVWLLSLTNERARWCGCSLPIVLQIIKRTFSVGNKKKIIRKNAARQHIYFVDIWVTRVCCTGLRACSIYLCLYDCSLSQMGWRLGLQAATGLLLSAFFLGTFYRSASLYHPQRRAILHLKTQRKKVRHLFFSFFFYCLFFFGSFKFSGSPFSF